jgi:3-deoxy-D-manno-octulosonic-acid transferase
VKRPNISSPGWGYRLLSLPLYLLWLAHAFRHGRKHGLANYLSMRFRGAPGDTEARVWVHASSVGEVCAIAPLVRALMERGEMILFTSFTATGYRSIQENFSNTVHSGIIPIEHSWHCQRFFARHNIKLGLVMETELWPELLYQGRRQGIRLILVNARLSAKSLHGGKFVRTLLSRTLGYFSHILTRAGADREALLSLGAQDDRIFILGNLKARTAEASPPQRIVERDYLLLASSHAGEEQQFLAAWPADLRHHLLVIAPRHPDRSASIQAQIENLGMRCSVRSKAQAIDPGTEVYLADTLGELISLMAFAGVVIMGGSFDSTGGHNLIEPASLGKAIITGPSDSNIVDDIALLGNGEAVLQVGNIDACWSAIRELLDHPERARFLGQEARSRLARQPDVVQAYLDAISPLL